ncbi:MAG TPA: hypothetical protein VN881_01005 [Candidatus Acidoferrales bacterium]|nr:hypothetical protein [Candidatus Acidoferrales bacterium]
MMKLAREALLCNKIGVVTGPQIHAHDTPRLDGSQLQPNHNQQFGLYAMCPKSNQTILLCAIV